MINFQKLEKIGILINNIVCTIFSDELIINFWKLEKIGILINNIVCTIFSDELIINFWKLKKIGINNIGQFLIMN